MCDTALRAQKAVYTAEHDIWLGIVPWRANGAVPVVIGMFTRLHYLASAPRVDQYGASQRACTASELTQHYSGQCVMCFTRHNVLKRRDVHAIADRSDHQHIGQAVQRTKLLCSSSNSARNAVVGSSQLKL
jgi:hypothetical protein